METAFIMEMNMCSQEIEFTYANNVDESIVFIYRIYGRGKGDLFT